MDYELRITVEKVAISIQKVVKHDTVKVYDIKSPQSIFELGLRHEEQLSLLEKVQNSLLAEQTVLIEANTILIGTIVKSGVMPVQSVPLAMGYKPCKPICSMLD